MKKHLVNGWLVILMMTISILANGQQGITLIERMIELPLVSLAPMQCDTFYSEKYEVFVKQFIDYHDTTIGRFNQRVIVGHRGFDRPVVFVTEGYSARYGANPKYVEELCWLLDANVILVEHRYFDKSVPEPLDWNFLTVENAANDHHRVIEMFKEIYPGKWVSTGISKGGQTAMYHRYFFPEDVDATVGYVCPLNFSTEDLRVYDFLDHVADSACRAYVRDFQVMMLERKADCLPAFKKLAKEKGYHYEGGYEWGYELMAMEYGFAFFQWGYIPCDKIPGPDTPADKVIEHLDKIARLDWVAEEGIRKTQPWFYQALTETGMYGYDISRFDTLLKVLKKGTFEFTCPDGYDCTYDPVPMEEVDDFVRHHADKMLFIYGGSDPWSATRVQWSGIPGVKVIVKPGGSHRTRIRNLPPDQQQEVYGLLSEWMGIEIEGF